MQNVIKLVGFDSVNETIAIFDSCSPSLKEKALDFIHGKRNKGTARAFLGLSTNNKMPCYTISLSERASCPRGGKLAKVPGTICSNCYAAHGADAWAPAINAKARRFALMQLATQNEYARRLVIEAFEIALTGEVEFRFHSSGDLFSDKYAALVAEICEQNKHVSFWIPTRESKQVHRFEHLENVAIRVSDDMVNQQTNKHSGLTSGAHTGNNGRGHICPAMDNGGACGDCRACWSKDVKHVSYKLH